MKPHSFPKVAISQMLVFFILASATAQKKSRVLEECLEGNCKDGPGLMKVYCSEGAKNYTASCQMEGVVYYYGSFRKGKPEGKGRLVWTAPDYVNRYVAPAIEEVKSLSVTALLEKSVLFAFEGNFRNGVPDGAGVMATTRNNLASKDYSPMGLPNWHLSFPVSFGGQIAPVKGTREIFYGDFTISDNGLTKKWEQKNAPPMVDYFKTDTRYYEFRRVDSVITSNGQTWAKLSVSDGPKSAVKASVVSKAIHGQVGEYLYEERNITREGKYVLPSFRPSLSYYLNGYSRNGWVIQDYVQGNPFVDSTQMYRVLYRNGLLIASADVPFPFDEQNWTRMQLPDGKQYEGAVNDQKQPHGYGEVSFVENGVPQYFQGYFAEGRQIGTGILLARDPSRLSTKAGYFEDFKLKRGYVPFGMDETYYYTGPFSDSSQVVYGSLVYGKQRYYKGQVLVPEMIPMGKGVFTYSNGLKNEGYFRGENLVSGATTKPAFQLALREVVKYNGVSTFVAAINKENIILANHQTIPARSDQTIEMDTQKAYYSFTCSCSKCNGAGKIAETRYAPPREMVTNYYAATTHMAGMYEYVGTKKETLYGTGGKYAVGVTCLACNGVGTWVCKTELK